MKVKYIDDDDAIWTLGYPFMSQFLMIFDMEENHVGIKRIKKTNQNDSYVILLIILIKAICFLL